MTLTYTHDDVVRYICNETSPEEAEAISGQLMVDPELQDFYTGAREILQEVCSLEFAPARKTIDRIVNYSRSFQLHTIP